MNGTVIFDLSHSQISVFIPVLLSYFQITYWKLLHLGMCPVSLIRPICRNQIGTRFRRLCCVPESRKYPYILSFLILKSIKICYIATPLICVPNCANFKKNDPYAEALFLIPKICQNTLTVPCGARFYTLIAHHLVTCMSKSLLLVRLCRARNRLRKRSEIV